MDVILLEKVHKLGELGEQVKVKPGFGRNYLIPNGKAVLATADNIAKFNARRAELKKQEQKLIASATTRAEKLNALTIDIPRKAGAEGKLFGSVGAIDIANAVTEAGVELSKHEIRLSEGPIRNTGEFEFVVRLHVEVSTTIKINIVPE